MQKWKFVAIAANWNLFLSELYSAETFYYPPFVSETIVNFHENTFVPESFPHVNKRKLIVGKAPSPYDLHMNGCSNSKVLYLRFITRIHG